MHNAPPCRALLHARPSPSADGRRVEERDKGLAKIIETSCAPSCALYRCIGVREASAARPIAINASIAAAMSGDKRGDVQFFTLFVKSPRGSLEIGDKIGLRPITWSSRYHGYPSHAIRNACDAFWRTSPSSFNHYLFLSRMRYSPRSTVMLVIFMTLC
jgi:hypothetical protein